MARRGRAFLAGRTSSEMEVEDSLEDLEEPNGTDHLLNVFSSLHRFRQAFAWQIFERTYLSFLITCIILKFLEGSRFLWWRKRTGLSWLSFPCLRWDFATHTFFAHHELQDPSSNAQTPRPGGWGPCWSCRRDSPSWISHPVLEGEGEEEHLRKGETFFWLKKFFREFQISLLCSTWTSRTRRKWMRTLVKIWTGQKLLLSSWTSASRPQGR